MCNDVLVSDKEETKYNKYGRSFVKHPGYVKHICVNCEREFWVTPCYEKRDNIKYCSVECYHQSRFIYVVRTCIYCGKEFIIKPRDVRRGQRYCSRKCGFNARLKLVDVKCPVCNKEFKVKFSRTLKRDKICCSNKCRGIFKSGENAYNWRGEDVTYCRKFTDSLKEEVRNAFNRKCYICGKPEEENTVINSDDTIRKLSVHHCDYNKSQGCKGLRWSLVPLCTSCHAKTNNAYKRWYWFALLRDYWIYKYIGDFDVLYEPTGMRGYSNEDMV